MCASNNSTNNNNSDMSQSSLEIDRELSSQERSYLDRPPSSREEENVVMGKVRLTGFNIGLVIQLLSLLGVIWLLHAEESDWPDSFMGAFLCGILAMVCWLALALCPVVWATPFILSMTPIGKPAKWTAVTRLNNSVTHMDYSQT
jgi:hypothetical protein